MAFDVPFADLRGAAKAAGGSVNDAFLSALLGEFRRYHIEMGSPIEQVPDRDSCICAPRRATPRAATIRGRAAGRTGRDRGSGAPHPGDQESGRARQGCAGPGRPRPAAPALARMPGPLISQFAGALTKSNDLQASNIPGLRGIEYLAGAKIERTYGFGPLPGCATMVTLVSHGETCCIAVNLHPAAVAEPERFARCLSEGFAEVLALSGGDAGAGSLIRRV